MKRPFDAGVAADLSPSVPRARARAELAALFAHAGLPSPDLDARVLVCSACGIDHAGLVRDPDLPLGLAASVLDGYARRRLAREPVSRILGTREFWGLPFAVTPAVLDPRADTEGLVGSILDATGGQRDRAYDLLDLGTGSGAILCALLHEMPNALGLGIDRSLAACQVAQANAAALGLAARARFVCGSWTQALGTRFDIVASNPPYIPCGDLAGLAPDVRDHDPALALHGGTDGLDAYRALMPRLPDLLCPSGFAAFECGFDQGEKVAGLMREAGLRGVMVYRDLAGHGRVVLGLSPPA